MEEQINAILGNPEMMAQIMQMAKSLGGAPGEPQIVQSAPAVADTGLELDPGLLQKLASVAGNIGINRDQRNLLTALRPYLSSSRLQKLEKAMRASSLASAASGFLSSGGLSLLTGR